MKKTIESITLSLLLGGSGFAAEMLYVGGYDGNTAKHTILKIGPNGQASTVLSNLPTADAVALACDQNGNLFFSNYGSNSVTKLTPSGISSVFAITGLSGPNSMAFDHVGNLYVGNEIGETVVRLDTNGVPTTVFSGRGRPVGVAVAPDGTVYIATDSTRTNACKKFIG